MSQPKQPSNHLLGLLLHPAHHSNPLPSTSSSLLGLLPARQTPPPLSSTHHLLGLLPAHQHLPPAHQTPLHAFNPLLGLLPFSAQQLCQPLLLPLLGLPHAAQYLANPIFPPFLLPHLYPHHLVWLRVVNMVFSNPILNTIPKPYSFPFLPYPNLPFMPFVTRTGS